MPHAAAQHAVRLRRLAFLASSSCGRQEYSQCTRQTDASQTSDAHHRLMSPPYEGRGIINERIQLSALLTTFQN